MGDIFIQNDQSDLIFQQQLHICAFCFSELKRGTPQLCTETVIKIVDTGIACQKRDFRYRKLGLLQKCTGLIQPHSIDIINNLFSRLLFEITAEIGQGKAKLL